MFKKFRNFTSIICLFAFAIIMCSGFAVKAAPAPSLSSISIIDLALDDNNEINVVVKQIGTSNSRFVYWNGTLCEENLNETQYLVGSDRIVYGYIRYFHTGIYYDSSLSGQTASVSATFINAMSPWNTLSTSTFFTIP